MPPRKAPGRPRKQRVGEEAASAPNVPPPPSQVPPIPPVPPVLPTPTQPAQPSVPQVSPEMFQAFMAYVNAYTQTQTTPAPVPVVASSAQNDNNNKPLSKLLKEAKQLGCEQFLGSNDAAVAKNWLKKVSKELSAMDLNDRNKLLVATRLLDQNAETWWENVQLRYSTELTWDDFVREFNDEYYSRFYRDLKRQEFYRLRQDDKTVSAYETELR